MKKPLLNIIIDVVSLMTVMFMISTGLILKFILPPGSGRVEMLLGSPGRRHQTIDVLMGLPRHDWGVIHLYISLGFLLLLIVHLFLHWNWIVCMLWGTKTAPQPAQRRIIAVASVVFIIFTLASPWFAQAMGQKKTYSRAEFLKTYEVIP